MSNGGADADAVREAAREALRELLPDMLRDVLGTPGKGDGNGNGHGHDGSGHANANGGGHPEPTDIVPQVPAPPVAAVLRPSTWSAPPVPGEVVGDGLGDKSEHVGQISHAIGGEPVTIDSDVDLNVFAQALAKRLENPRERRAVRTGQVRFTLRRTAAAVPTAAAAPASPALRIEKGAVTERMVRQAAADGARLVLARGAVLTPLARDQARALGVEIEKERTC